MNQIQKRILLMIQLNLFKKFKEDTGNTNVNHLLEFVNSFKNKNLEVWGKTFQITYNSKYDRYIGVHNLLLMSSMHKGPIGNTSLKRIDTIERKANIAIYTNYSVNLKDYNFLRRIL